MVFATDNVRDLHIPVVNDDTEVIGWRTIGATDNQIVQLLIAEFNRATDLIVKNNGTVLWVSETYNAGFIISVMFVAVAAAAVVARFVAIRHLFFA
ncbi:hypothetical protein D3C78_1297300 [compost metagenome]